jgi:pimeloyl-ACP methyl ester carboxylesterase
MTDLVLIHGFSLDARMWSDLAGRLEGVARVHAVDLPGCGASREPPARTVDAMADAVRRSIDALGLTRFALGGLSMGGYVALAYWRRHAPARPSQFLLFDTRAEADTEEARRQRDATAEAVLRELELGPFAARMLPRLLASGASATVRDDVRRMIESQQAATVAACARAMRDRADATDVLPTIDVPTLVVCGAEDVMTPPEGMQRLAAAIPGARFALVPRAGHLAPMEEPAACAGLVRRFLAGERNF